MELHKPTGKGLGITIAGLADVDTGSKSQVITGFLSLPPPPPPQVVLIDFLSNFTFIYVPPDLLGELSGIYITSLNPTGTAARDGRLQEGDRILKVDNTSLRGMENMEAASVLRNTGNPVRLVLTRHKERQRTPSPEGEKLKHSFLRRYYLLHV